MLTKRRHIWAIGLLIGVLVVIFFLFGPKKSAEQRIAEDVAILAREPWHTVHVQRVAFRGSELAPTDVFLHGARPDGTPLVVQFVHGSPYTSSTAIQRISERPLAGMTVELLLIPRSLVHKTQRDRIDADATHAGIALFSGVAAVDASMDDDLEMTPDPEPESDTSSEDSEEGHVSQHENG
jgi:hypothetical protein